MGQSAISPEHILLGILKEKSNSAHKIFRSLAVDEQRVISDLSAKSASSSVGSATMDAKIDPSNMPFSDSATNILRLAVLEARVQHSAAVDAEHLLLAILHDKRDTIARNTLENADVDYGRALSSLTATAGRGTLIFQGTSQMFDDTEQDSYSNGGSKTYTKKADDAAKSKTPVIDHFSFDLTKAAREGVLDPVVARESEMQRVIEILLRRKKNNPVLIGEPGVGKSSIVEGIAQKIVGRQTSPLLFGKRLVSLDLTAVVAGTKYRGQFEERLQALIRELENSPDIIVFIDEIHTMVGAGDSSRGMDAANIMKPALARGRIQCIGATTLDEFRNSIEKDGALDRRFQKVMVQPSSADDTMTILNNVKERYEEFHHVEYSSDAIAACVRLTERYVSDRCLPDKAIDALDEAGARKHLASAHLPADITELQRRLEEAQSNKNKAVVQQDFKLAASYREEEQQLSAQIEARNEAWKNDEGAAVVRVEAEDVAEVVSVMSGVPVEQLNESETRRLQMMAPQLKNSVIAQDRAVEIVSKCIQRNRLGLKDPNRPIGVFMFLGPTGVGKTYLAQSLATLMFGSKDALIRIDMSEYSESFNVSRLVGAPPGYVGYDEGGQLTERVRRHPYSIVLLDEIEKAHSSIFNTLLQVLDEGRMTDGNGRLIDFRNTVIIMTSNAGTRQLKEFGRGIGFQSGVDGGLNKDNARSIIQKSLSRQFAPEFLNRIDEIVTFDPLGPDAVRKIAAIEAGKLADRLKSTGISLQFSDDAIALVASRGYDVQYGARPIRRALQSLVEDPVCEMLLCGKLKDGDTVTARREAGAEKLVFDEKTN